MRYPTAAEWNGKEKSCSVPTAAYPPAVDTIVFRVWRTHSVLLTGAHGAVAAAETVSLREWCTHASRATKEVRPVEKVEG